jgi:ATP-binding cassette subfamily B protein AbcA/BmrA
MYEPTGGEILYGSMNSRGFKLDGWRKAFGIVAQDEMAMSGTVRDNICYGVERQVSDEELISVAKKANTYDFIMETPGGFGAEMGVD